MYKSKKHYHELLNFLKDYKVESGNVATNNLMGPPYGSYYIHHTVYDVFIEKYCNCLLENNGKNLHFVETHKAIAPVVIDLDFRHTTTERCYDEKYIIDFVHALSTTLFKYIHEQVISIYVLQKPSPRPVIKKSTQNNTATLYKDGIHIVVPEVITCPAFQFALRNCMLQEHGDLIKRASFTNDILDIYDAAVIESNGWMMYGSLKDGEEHPWKVTHLFRCTKTDPTPWLYTKDWNDPLTIRNLVKELSIRCDVIDEIRYTIDGNSLVKRYKHLGSSSSCASSIKNVNSHSVCKSATSQNLDIACQLVDMLSIERADNYEKWLHLGFCLHNIDDGNILLDKWKEFSSRVEDKFDETRCDKVWNKAHNDGGLGMGSLHMWAKADSPVSYIQLMSEVKCPGDQVSIFDLIKSKYKYDYSYVKQVFEKDYAKIIEPACYVKIEATDYKVKDKVKLRDSYSTLYCSKKYQNKNGEITNKIIVFIEEWLKDDEVRIYKSIDFLPPPLVCPDGVLNTWSGFEIDKHVNIESSQNIDPFLYHTNLLCGFDQKSHEYFIKWLAQLIQQPGKLIGIAIILFSQEGAGKNIFLDLFSKMIGERYYNEVSNPEHELFGRFSNARNFKLLVDLDEAKRKDTFSNSDVLKNMITSEYINCESKGVDPMRIRNYARFVLTTNNVVCAKITDTTRRFVIFEVSNIMRGNQQYFHQFASYMTDLPNQKAIMEYLRSVDISNINWITERPISDTYNALKSICSDPLLRFLAHFLQSNFGKPNVILPAKSLLALFKDYMKNDLKLKDEHIITWNQTMFGLQMKNHCQPHSGITKKVNVGPTKCHGYSFDMSEFKAYIIKLGIINAEDLVVINFEDSIDS